MAGNRLEAAKETLWMTTFWILGISIILAILTGLDYGFHHINLIPQIPSLVARNYDSIHIPRGDVSEFWGAYGIYGVIIGFEFPMLDKFGIVKTPTGWLILILIAIAVIAVPFLILTASQQAITLGYPPLYCGSWLAPTVSGRSVFCASALDGAARIALTVMAIGFGLPLLLMTLRVLRERRRKRPKARWFIWLGVNDRTDTKADADLGIEEGYECPDS